MFRLESLDFTTTKEEFVENVMILKNHVMFNEITINVEYVDYMNKIDREIVEITVCDDSYCVNVYDYTTKNVVIEDMYFERLVELCEYVSSMYFEDEEDDEEY